MAAEDEKAREQEWQDAVADDHFTYDMCMVFTCPPPAENSKNLLGQTVLASSKIPDFTGPDIVERLRDAGLKTHLYQSIGHDEVYCLIGASEKRLAIEADRIDLDLLFNEKVLDIAYDKKISLAVKTKEKMDKQNVDSTTKLISDDLWKNIYGKFDPSKTNLYTTYNTDGPMHKDSFFRSTDRLNLLQSIIEAPTKLNGAGLSIVRLKAMPNTHLKALFPLHEPAKLEQLSSKWLSLRGIWTPPLEEIRNYYGEKIALYFAFLNFYTRMLLIPSFFGFIWILVQRARSNVNSNEQIVTSRELWLFALLIIGWGATFLELWKRKQSYFRVQWGMSSFQEKEQTRPEFRGEWVVNPIDGKLTTYLPTWKKFLLYGSSTSVVILLILAVIASVAGVFIARLKIQEAVDSTQASIYGALINVAVIQFFNAVYRTVGKFLNEFENHRTDTDYENSLIAKSFLFNFVNNYNSFFYIAFFKNWVEPKGCISGATNHQYPCMEVLSTQLLIVFGTMIIVNNFFELAVPMIMERLEAKKQQGDSKEVKSFPETEFEKADYESTFDDFNELAIQFGYVTLFVVAMPAAPILAFANNLLESYIDSSKLLKLTKRPEPRGAFDIGTWLSIFNCIAWISIATNIGLVVLYTNEIRQWAGYSDQTLTTSSTYDSTAVAKLALIFFGIEHLLGLLKFAIEWVIPDDPAEVVAHIARQQYLVDLLVRDASEEADDAETGRASVSGGEVRHVAELFTLLDDAGTSDGDFLRVPLKVNIDSHCTFKATAAGGTATELISQP